MRLLTTLSLLLAITAGAIVQGEEASFQGLGFLPGHQDYSQARGVSADGSTVVGFTKRDFSFPPLTLEHEEAFRWTAADEMVSLGNLQGSGGFADDVSADGSVIVGASDRDAYGAFRWTQEEGITGIGEVPGGGFAMWARSVSTNGSVVVGTTSDNAAFRWTEADGAMMLPHLGGIADPTSSAWATSADGSVVVGNTSGRPSRWTESSGTVSLGVLPPEYDTAFPSAISADGSVIVGMFQTAQGGQMAFRWTETDGYTILGDLPGGDVYSFATSVSSDGSLIVGHGSTDMGDTAFAWDQEHGMRNLNQVLTDEYGLDLGEWWLRWARDVSADGSVIVGDGINPAGKKEPWRAVLSVVVLLGDVNLDGRVDGLDVDPFVSVLLNGVNQVEADMNEDEVVNGLDVDPFVAAVIGGGTRRIPEPSTLLLCSVALGIVGGWRKWGG